MFFYVAGAVIFCVFAFYCFKRARDTREGMWWGTTIFSVVFALACVVMLVITLVQSGGSF